MDFSIRDGFLHPDGAHENKGRLLHDTEEGALRHPRGQYIPETLMNAVIELEAAYDRCKADPSFQAELTQLLNDYAGRPSRLYYAKKMTEDLGGARIYLKREDLNHTGAHKINNVLGQTLLARRMGKTRLIAETGAGQHGVATATAAALFGMECVVYMGEEDTKRQALNVYKGRLPDAVLASVGGGSNAIGAFYHFIDAPSVRLIGCEAAGRGIDTPETAATINTGREGIFHGMKSYFCQDKYGQIAPVYSISAGLDYPGIGPEHAYLHDIGRAEYVGVTDEQAVNAFEYLSRTEGIIPAIESAHAVAHAMELAPTMRKDQIIVINISGRGDKDCAAIARYRGEDLHA